MCICVKCVYSNNSYVLTLKKFSLQAALRFIKGLEGTVSDVVGENTILLCDNVIVSVTGKELELLYPLMLSIHTPYSQVLLRYPTLEQQQLAKKLQDIKIV